MRRFSPEELRKFMKFGVTGGLNTAVDFLVYTLLLTVFGVNLYAAQVAGYACGTLNSYIINRSWTFHSKGSFFGRELWKFIAVNLVTLGISLGAMFLLQLWFPSLGKIVLKLPIVALTLVVNFILSRLWVFRG